MSVMDKRTEETLNRLSEFLDSGDTDTMLVGAGDLLSGILNEFNGALSILSCTPSDLLRRPVAAVRPVRSFPARVAFGNYVGRGRAWASAAGYESSISYATNRMSSGG